MNLNLKSIKKTKRQQAKSFRRQLGAAKGYQAPIVVDAFEFTGPEISKERERFYLKNIVEIGLKPVFT